MDQNKRWLTPSDFEKEFAIPRNSQCNLRSKKRIPYSKIGGYIRYDRDKINDWLENHCFDIVDYNN